MSKSLLLPKLLCITFVLLMSAYISLGFEKAPPLKWKYVGRAGTTDLTHFTVLLHYVSPCTALSSHYRSQYNVTFSMNGNETDNAASAFWNVEETCQAYIEKELFEPLHNYTVWFERYKKEFRFKRDAPSIRFERDLTDGMTYFTTGYFLSNIVTTILHKIWPSRFERNMVANTETLDSKIRSINSVINASSNLSRELVITINEVKKELKNLAELQEMYPELSWLISTIITGVKDTKSRYHRLRFSFQNNQVDLVALSELLDTEWFNDIIPQTAVPYNFRWSDESLKDKLKIEFLARRKDRDTRIFRVETVDFWNPEGETNKLVKYKGPKLIAYNSKMNCVRGLSKADFEIETTCNTPNFTDSSLMDWYASKESPRVEKTPVSMIRGWPTNIVHCFTHEINIRGLTFPCPPYPFYINSTTPFKAGNFSYSPNMKVIDKSLRNSNEFTPDMSFIDRVHIIPAVVPSEDILGLKIYHLQEQLAELTLQANATVNIPLIDMKFHLFTIQNFIIALLVAIILAGGCYLLYLRIRIGLREDTVESLSKAASKYARSQSK